jgi:mono/diheme cytochrome c family protein
VREDFPLIALGGYMRPSAGRLLMADEAYLAFTDASLSALGSALRFEPIPRRQLDPAPFYRVWSGEERGDTHRYPWPFQLATIDRVPFECRHPHTAPAGAAPNSPKWRGDQLFRAECVMCHSINGEGGKAGPELRVQAHILVCFFAYGSWKTLEQWQWRARLGASLARARGFTAR